MPQLHTLFARSLNLDEGVLHDCCIRVWKSLEINVELIPCQEYSVETIQRIRYTVKEIWRGSPLRQNDTGWVEQLGGVSDDHYRALHGRKPAFIEAFFQVDCEYVEATRRPKLALLKIPNPVNSRYVDLDESLVLVETPPDSKKYEIIDIHEIVEAAQLVPMHTENGAAVQRWVVHSRMDLNSFGWIDYDDCEQHDDMGKRRL